MHARVDLRDRRLGWVLLTQSWWPISAWAGPARPSTAAVRPLAMMVANPSFFIALSFFVFQFDSTWFKQRGQSFNSDGSN